MGNGLLDNGIAEKQMKSVRHRQANTIWRYCIWIERNFRSRNPILVTEHFFLSKLPRQKFHNLKGGQAFLSCFALFFFFSFHALEPSFKLIWTMLSNFVDPFL